MSYDQAFEAVVGSEGSELDLSRNDRGNWTSGIVEVGELNGSRWGISAAAYPHVNIAALGKDDAKKIYKTDYWDKVRGDDLPPNLAYVVFDAAVNNGVGAAIKWLQKGVGANVDGVIGPATVGMAVKTSQIDAIISVMASRTYLMGCLPLWKDEPGWAIRLATIPFTSLRMT